MMRFGLAVSALALLAGCAAQPGPTTRAEVVRFHEDGFVSAGQSFQILPGPGQAEAARYPDLVEDLRGVLQRAGLRPAEPGESPDLFVTMDYSVSETSPTETTPGDFHTWGGFGAGTALPLDSQPRFLKSLAVAIYDQPTLDAGAQEPVWYGQVLMPTRGRDIGQSMSALATALFNTFPGTSGQVAEVTLPESLP